MKIRARKILPFLILFISVVSANPVTPSLKLSSGFAPDPQAENLVLGNPTDATFNMTNILPQAADNNQGPWVKLENFGRTLAGQGKELYIYAGAFGTGGTGKKGFKNTIASGEVKVPKTFWKIMIILPLGNKDLTRIDENTRAIAVCMPNKQGIRNVPWQKFVTTIGNVETATGYTFLSPLTTDIQQALKSRNDSAGTGTGNPCQ